MALILFNITAARWGERSDKNGCAADTFWGICLPLKEKKV